MTPVRNTTHGWGCWEAGSIIFLTWPHIFPLHHYHLHLIVASWSCLAWCGYSAGLGPWLSPCDVCWAQPFLSQQDSRRGTWARAEHTKQHPEGTHWGEKLTWKGLVQGMKHQVLCFHPSAMDENIQTNFLILIIYIAQNVSFLPRVGKLPPTLPTFLTFIPS